MVGRALAGLALLVVLAGGCARPVVAPLDRGTTPEVEALEELVRSCRGAVRNLRTEARMSFRSPEGSGSAREILLVERPDRLRVEVVGMFGTPFVLVTSGGRLAAYVAEERRVYRGVADARTLYPYLFVELPPRDAVDLLLGCPPWREGGHASLFYDPTGGEWRLWRPTGGGTAQVVLFSRAPHRTIGVEEHDREGLLWRARFSGHVRVGGVEFPREISLEVPREGSRVEIEFQEPELNVSLDPLVFELRTPSGAEDVWIEG
ncbi:MAG: hypothetical protein KatS3mg076_2151 [Candidatus Binatia bacterium]|nr:MAG: hypothetical protein KatS3mg076_2151 [Candidatus Binatia bacterium]